MLEQSLNKEEEVSLGGSHSKKEVLIISKDNAQKQSSKAKKSQSNDQGGNTESAKPSHYELEIVKNVIDIKGFTVRWHSKKTKDVFIHENICKVCDRKFNLRELLKDRNLQIEAQTNQLLSKHGMMAQVGQHEQKNNQIRREGRKQAKIYATDIKKMQILVEKLEFKVQKIKN